ncbi:C39 family peptidase [Polymorphospora sp. NPDC051019]|uniref:C39 family peptidase n=1 Tax=Polymorphospora sp. NPDC051019 TaxID=3155725 RepID=UPI0034302837
MSPPRPPGRGSRAVRPILLAGLCAAALATTGTPPATAGGVPAAPADHGIHTVRTAAGYDVRVDGVTRATVAVSDPGFSVRAVLDPTGRHAAVITDFDGRYGAGLLALDVDSGRLTRVAAGRVTSAAYTTDGRLGYVLAGTDSGQLRLRPAEGAGPDRAVARLTGSDVQLLGWGTGGAALVTHRLAGPGSGPSLSRVDLATGTHRTVLASTGGTVYRDLRTVTVGGAVRVSAIVADHVYPCAGTSASLLLADEHGTTLTRTGTTTDSYREAVWSGDGRVAYAIQGCVSPDEKAAGRGRALQRLDDLNGVYVRDLETGGIERVVAGITANYRLDGFAGTGLRLASERLGVRIVDATDAVTAAHLDAAATPTTATVTSGGKGTGTATTGGAGVQAKIVPSTFIHQLWDTADNFNGNSACGPTSVVMDLAGYQLANQNGYYVSTPSRHWSPYGGYITHRYTAYGTTYDAVAPDPNWNYFAGAYGWLVDTPSVGTLHHWLRDYLDRHVSYTVAETGNVTWSWIKSKIDANLMVVVSGNFAYGRYGHIALITGYLDDGRVYVNDPYGAGTDGSWDGKNTAYTLDYMRGWYAWAA